MLKNLLFAVLIFSFILPTFGQEKFSVSGTVTDASNGETIVGANVIVKELNQGVPTNVYGFYSLTLPKGTYVISYSFIGYQTTEKNVVLDKNTTINIEMQSGVIEGPTVVIEGEKSKNTESTEMGRAKLEVESIKKLPALLGEVDILKTIQYLPGIQSAGEGNSGFYVRGGGPDQNLILLDNATIYNASHLFGFFSVFNADAVKNVEVIKGGMPASYGGRVSSVLDITLKEGNKKEYVFEGGIGLISSRFTAQGPIKKGVSSFIVSGRRTYIDVLARPLIEGNANFAGSGYYFFDLNAKFNHRFSDKDQIFASGYFGRDIFSFNSSQIGFGVEIPWGNSMASVRWNHLFNDQLFMNTNVTYSQYNFAFNGSQDDFKFSLKSGIEDWSGKVQLSWYPNLKHEIKGGVDYVYHTFSPSQASAQSEDVVFDLGENMLTYSHETAVYIQDEITVTDVLKINAGLRYSSFAHVGPFTRFLEDPNQSDFSQTQPKETIVYNRGELVKFYGGFEPRLSARYTLNERSSLKAGFSQNYQYVHLASLTPTSLPGDVWLPSSDVVNPQFGRQYSIGYFRNFLNDKWETSVELYYKDMDNLVEYEEGASPENTLNNNADNQLVFGSGYSYGAEFFIKKSVGDLNGWVGYTWSKTMRLFEDLNNGNEYPSRFDRRHDLSLVLSYKLSDKWEFGGVFVYGTGSSITLPVSRYFYEGQVVDVYGDRNGFRMAPYHRVDFAATLTPKNSKENIDPETGEKISTTRRFKSSWVFSVYNLYNRQNPYFIYFGNDGNLSEGNLEIKAFQVSLFPILPSVTWNFRF